MRTVLMKKSDVKCVKTQCTPTEDAMVIANMMKYCMKK